MDPKKRILPGKVPWDTIAPHVNMEFPEEVFLGPGRGEDAALLRLGGGLYAVASDPITFTTMEAGRLAVLVNANDVAVRGARPCYFTAVVLLAPGDGAAGSAEAILDQVRAACRSVGAYLVGGHTEISPGLSRTIVCGTMIGRVEGRPVRTGGLRPNDRVGITRWAGIEGTAILLDTFGKRLKALEGAEPFEEAEHILQKEWLSVVPEALAAAACPGVTALHDVTEGGVGEALYEMAAASGVFLRVETGPEGRPCIPLLPATEIACARLGLDPIGLIGSGSLVVGCAEEGAAELEAALSKLDVPFTWIGRAETAAGAPGTNLPRFERDEILRAEKMEGLRAVLFDLDGTLVESDYDWPAIKQELGIQGISILDELAAMAGPEGEAKRRRLAEIEDRATGAARVKEGAVELLAFLRGRGIRTALVTNNTRANTRRLLEKFGLAFDVVLCRDDGFYKPSGAPLKEALRRLEFTPEQALCAGDSHFDVLAGREAGCRWVCILHDQEGRYRDGADLFFEDLPAFQRFLEVAL